MMTAEESPSYVTPLSSDAVIRQTRRLMVYLAQTQAELERFVADLERSTEPISEGEPDE